MAMKMKKDKTYRGFAFIKFEDLYGAKCSLQKSSLATENAIWFGVDDPAPKILAHHAADHGVETDETTGWVPYPISDKVSLTTRMHLTRWQVLRLLPSLIKFVITGEI